MNIDDITTPSVLAFVRARKEQLLTQPVTIGDEGKQVGRLEELDLIERLCEGLSKQHALISKAMRV